MTNNQEFIDNLKAFVEKIRLRVIDGVFNVKDYGAFGNFDDLGQAAHDDTRAIQDALNAAGPNQVVYIPPGQYLVSNLTVGPEQVLMGAGRDQTILRGKIGSVGPFIEDNGSAVKIILRDFAVYGNNVDGYTAGIKLGYNAQLFGTEGFLANLWIRDMPNAVGLWVNGNVGYGYCISIQDVADGMIIQGNANIWSMIGIAGSLGGEGHYVMKIAGSDVHGVHLEAPASNCVPLYFDRESSVTGISFSLANNTTFSHIIEVDAQCESWWLDKVTYLFNTLPGTVVVINGNIKAGGIYFGGNATGGSLSGNGSFTNEAVSTVRAQLLDGTSLNSGVLKLWDATLGAWRYLTIDNGSVVISSTPPT